MAHSTPDYFSKHNKMQLGDAHYVAASSQNGMYSPNRNTVKTILAYSRALEVQSSKSIKNSMVILN